MLHVVFRNPQELGESKALGKRHQSAIRKFRYCRGLGTDARLLAAALAGAALGANATRAGTDHLVAAANGTGDSHKYAAKSHCYTVGVTIAIPVLPARLGIARWMICDDVDYFFLGCAR